jgi:putative ABC transport system permease protein
VTRTVVQVVRGSREQIGLLKALGYRNASIVLHYLKFVGIISAVGIVIGSAVGTWLGAYVTGIFGDFFRFPFTQVGVYYNLFDQKWYGPGAPNHYY